ncbi:MAG: carbohydrate ABC transporter permease, partial [Cellulosilyticaceae bacterium]
MNPIFQGMKHYIYAFTQDTYFSTALVQGITYIVLCTPLVIVFALIISLLLNNNFRGRTLFRAIYFLPVIIISGPVMAELTSNGAVSVISPSMSIVYKLFAQIPLLGAPITYAFSNIVMILWFSGVQVLIFLAGLQKIDKSLYEVAKIDGASGWEMFWKITIVQLKPLILVNTIYTILELASFPNNGINKHIVNNMFITDKLYAYSTAMSWIYFVVTLVIIGIAFLILKEKKERR